MYNPIIYLTWTFFLTLQTRQATILLKFPFILSFSLVTKFSSVQWVLPFQYHNGTILLEHKINIRTVLRFLCCFFLFFAHILSYRLERSISANPDFFFFFQFFKDILQKMKKKNNSFMVSPRTFIMCNAKITVSKIFQAMPLSSFQTVQISKELKTPFIKDMISFTLFFFPWPVPELRQKKVEKSQWSKYFIYTDSSCLTYRQLYWLESHFHFIKINYLQHI